MSNNATTAIDLAFAIPRMLPPDGLVDRATHGRRDRPRPRVWTWLAAKSSDGRLFGARGRHVAQPLADFALECIALARWQGSEIESDSVVHAALDIATLATFCHRLETILSRFATPRLVATGSDRGEEGHDAVGRYCF